MTTGSSRGFGEVVQFQLSHLRSSLGPLPGGVPCATPPMTFRWPDQLTLQAPVVHLRSMTSCLVGGSRSTVTLFGSFFICCGVGHGSFFLGRSSFGRLVLLVCFGFVCVGLVGVGLWVLPCFGFRGVDLLMDSTVLTPFLGSPGGVGGGGKVPQSRIGGEDE